MERRAILTSLERTAHARHGQHEEVCNMGIQAHLNRLCDVDLMHKRDIAGVQYDSSTKMTRLDAAIALHAFEAISEGATFSVDFTHVEGREIYLKNS
jgi:hypothetical protein